MCKKIGKYIYRKTSEVSIKQAFNKNMLINLSFHSEILGKAFKKFQIIFVDSGARVLDSSQHVALKYVFFYYM